MIRAVTTSSSNALMELVHGFVKVTPHALNQSFSVKIPRSVYFIVAKNSRALEFLFFHRKILLLR